MTKAAEAAGINRDYYDRPAPGRADYWRYMAAPRLRARTLRRLLAEEPPRRLVDLGCGDGTLLAELAASWPGLALAGIDLSERQVEDNRRSWPAVDWRVADLAAELPAGLPRGSFDAVVASEVVEHVAAPDRFLANAAALAASGGRLLLSTQSGPVRETERRVGHQRHFSAAQMRELLATTGWRPERVWNAGWPFHDLSKWWANRDPDATMRRFGERPYGAGERLVCAALRLLFALGSRRRGAQLFAVARKAEEPARGSTT